MLWVVTDPRGHDSGREWVRSRELRHITWSHCLVGPAMPLIHGTGNLASLWSSSPNFPLLGTGLQFFSCKAIWQEPTKQTSRFQSALKQRAVWLAGATVIVYFFFYITFQHASPTRPLPPGFRIQLCMFLGFSAYHVLLQAPDWKKYVSRVISHQDGMCVMRRHVTSLASFSWGDCQGIAGLHFPSMSSKYHLSAH